MKSTGPKAPEPWLSRLAPPGLPVQWNARLIKYLEFYRDSPKGRAIIAAWLRRKGRYEHLINKVLKKHGLPRDLIYVAMVESGFNPGRTSRVGAGGMWQFMSRTGRGYGLNRDYWLDERRNPKLSTEAAARYLKDLHSRFNSWELALAAYNAGVGAVNKAIRKYNTNDYWQLCRYEAGLPWSTTLYVPKILAVAIVARNRTYFGFGHIKPDPPRPFDLVAVSTSVTLTHAAVATGAAKSALKELNPELRRGRTPPSSRAWLRIPRGTRDRFYTWIARTKGSRSKYRPYISRLGDTMRELASYYRLSVRRLRRINGMKRNSELKPGLVILVPGRRAPRREETATSAPPPRAPKGKKTDAERILVALPPGAPTRVAGRARVFYRVVYGDTLTHIARHLEVRPSELARWNRIDPGARLLSGLVLQAFVSPSFDRRRVALLAPASLRVMITGSEEHLNTFERRKGRSRLTYVARSGDSLVSVGRRFGLSVGSLMRINKFGRNTRLRQGQTLVVYLDPKKLKPKRRRRGKAGRRAGSRKQAGKKNARRPR